MVITGIFTKMQAKERPIVDSTEDATDQRGSGGKSSFANLVVDIAPSRKKMERKTRQKSRDTKAHRQVSLRQAFMTQSAFVAAAQELLIFLEEQRTMAMESKLMKEFFPALRNAVKVVSISDHPDYVTKSAQQGAR